MRRGDEVLARLCRVIRLSCQIADRLWRSEGYRLSLWPLEDWASSFRVDLLCGSWETGLHVRPLCDLGVAGSEVSGDNVD